MRLLKLKRDWDAADRYREEGIRCGPGMGKSLTAETTPAKGWLRDDGRSFYRLV